MMLTRWRPFGSLHRELDELFRPSNGDSVVTYAPSVDIEEEQERFLIRADLPGLEERDIEVKVHDGTLMLSGKREEKVEQEEGGRIYRERRFGSFHRSFTLGRNVDPEGIKASYDRGVLTVELPKKPESKPRQIEVKNN